MSKDYLQYECLVEEAMRGVIREALGIVAREGLQGEHYFHITFRTDHPGVDIPASLRREYPVEMPVILQNAFWDLEVGEIGFSVSLSFNQVQQRLTVPFDAITVFQDPPASFQLQFQADGDDDGAAPDEAAAAKREALKMRLAARKADAQKESSAENEAGGREDDDRGDDDSGAKVVTLDAFRNK